MLILIVDRRQVEKKWKAMGKALVDWKTSVRLGKEHRERHIWLFSISNWATESFPLPCPQVFLVYVHTSFISRSSSSSFILACKFSNSDLRAASACSARLSSWVRSCSFFSLSAALALNSSRSCSNFCSNPLVCRQIARTKLHKYAQLLNQYRALEKLTIPHCENIPHLSCSFRTGQIFAQAAASLWLDSLPSPLVFASPLSLTLSHSLYP